MDWAEVVSGGECAYWDELGRGGFTVISRWVEKGGEVRTAKSNPPNFVPICSKAGQMGISSSFFPGGTERRPVSPPNHTLLIVFSRCSGVFVFVEGSS